MGKGEVGETLRWCRGDSEVSGQGTFSCKSAVVIAVFLPACTGVGCHDLWLWSLPGDSAVSDYRWLLLGGMSRLSLSSDLVASGRCNHVS